MDRQADLIKLVSRQLGRKPSIVFRVALECPFGWPAVILNQPFTLEGKPNPNLYYLTCPFLRRRLARLEDSGLIRDLEVTMKEDQELAENLRRAQKQHRLQWLHAAGEILKDRAASGGALEDIPAPNIAAAQNNLSIKCLHAHAAWFLVHQDYRLGGIIMGKAAETWCTDEMCRRMT